MDQQSDGLVTFRFFGSKKVEYLVMFTDEIFPRISVFPQSEWTVSWWAELDDCLRVLILLVTIPTLSNIHYFVECRIMSILLFYVKLVAPILSSMLPRTQFLA